MSKTLSPGFLKMMLGKELTQQAIMRMVDSIQYPAVTADLALHILDLLVIRLIPVAPLMLWTTSEGAQGSPQQEQCHMW